jgi:hypothetical protein
MGHSKARGGRAGKRRKSVRFGQLDLCDAIGQLSFRARCTPHRSKTVSPVSRIQVTAWICQEDGETTMVQRPISIIPTQQVIAYKGIIYDVEWMDKDQRLLKPRKE